MLIGRVVKCIVLKCWWISLNFGLSLVLLGNSSGLFGELMMKLS